MRIITRPVSDQRNNKTKTKQNPQKLPEKTDTIIMWANRQEVSISVCQNM